MFWQWNLSSKINVRLKWMKFWNVPEIECCFMLLVYCVLPKVNSN